MINDKKTLTAEELVNGFVDHLRSEWEEGRWNGPDYQRRLTEVVLSFAAQAVKEHKKEHGCG